MIPKRGKMSKSELALVLLMSCASAALGAAQSLPLVQHPFRHNRSVPGEIFGDPDVSNFSTASSATESFLPGKYLVGPEVHPTTTWWEAEEEIAVDPADPLLLVAAISDFSLSRYGFPYTNQTKYAWSSDGGFHWRQSFMPYNQSGSGNPLTADGLSWNEMSDPVVAIELEPQNRVPFGPLLLRF